MSTNPPEDRDPADGQDAPPPAAQMPPAPPGGEESDPVVPPEAPMPRSSDRAAPPPPGYVAPPPVNPYLAPPTGAPPQQTPASAPFTPPVSSPPPPPGPGVAGAVAYGQPQPAGMGNGAKVGLGTGLGCLSYVLAIPVFFVLMPYLSAWGPYGWLLIFVVPVLIGAALMIRPTSRRVGLGMLIISAAAWLVVIGPCIALLGGFS